MSTDPSTSTDASPDSVPATPSGADSVAQPVIQPTSEQIKAAADTLRAEMSKLPGLVAADLNQIALEFGPAVAEWSLNGGSDNATAEIYGLMAERVGVRGIDAEGQVEQTLKDILFAAGRAAVAIKL